MASLIPRSAYLAGPADNGKDRRLSLHRAYHAQFVTSAHVGELVRSGMIERIRKSRDPHFNDIPLSDWDSLAMSFPIPQVTLAKMRECGDYPTLAGAVCILKEAARQIREGTANV